MLNISESVRFIDFIQVQMVAEDLSRHCSFMVTIQTMTIYKNYSFQVFKNILSVRNYALFTNAFILSWIAPLLKTNLHDIIRFTTHATYLKCLNRSSQYNPIKLRVELSKFDIKGGVPIGPLKNVHLGNKPPCSTK